MRCNNTSYHRMTRGRSRARTVPIYSAVFIRAVRVRVRMYLRDGLLAYRYGCACVPAISEGEAQNTAPCMDGKRKKRRIGKTKLAALFRFHHAKSTAALVRLHEHFRKWPPPGNKGNGFPSMKAKIWKNITSNMA